LYGINIRAYKAFCQASTISKDYRTIGYFIVWPEKIIIALDRVVVFMKKLALAFFGISD